jgi:type II restriction enzyme
MNPTANKGEWSELYVLLKILSEHKVAAADKELRPTDAKYTFLKVFRKDEPGADYTYDLADPDTIVIRNGNGEEVKTVSIADIPEKTRKIFERIKAGGDKAAFGIDEAKEPMNDLLIKKIKAGSEDKSDIVAAIRDHITEESAPIGFSIKSRVGGAPTLFNASQQTNFTYKVVGFTGDIDSVNALAGTKERLHAIAKAGGSLEFQHADGEALTYNMRVIDTVLPEMMASMLADYYSGNASGLKEASVAYSEKSPYGLDADTVAYKMKSFLRVVALGMVPGRKWGTRLTTYGGYIVVMGDGLLLCYSLHNDDDFRDYLFNHTKFETPSSTRHKFGSIYSDEDGQLFIKLNLQIRFTK